MLIIFQADVTRNIETSTHNKFVISFQMRKQTTYHSI